MEENKSDITWTCSAGLCGSILVVYWNSYIKQDFFLKIGAYWLATEIYLVYQFHPTSNVLEVRVGSRIVFWPPQTNKIINVSLFPYYDIFPILTFTLMMTSPTVTRNTRWVGQQRILTTPRHLILPLSFCSVLIYVSFLKNWDSWQFNYIFLPYK